MNDRVATVGMFDGVHLGHRRLLEFLRLNATGRQPLAITFSNHPLSVVNPGKAPMLLSSPDEKAALIEGCGVQPVMLDFDNHMRRLTSEEFMRMIAEQYGVSTLIMGFNNRIGSDVDTPPSQYVAIGQRLGVKVLTSTPLQISGSPISSTRIRTHLLEGHPEKASELLGRDYTLFGIVGRGKQIGRTIGFPTANIVSYFPAKLLPKPGVYSGEAVLADESRHLAVINIGQRPSVDADPACTIEAHLPDFTGDLYGQPVTVSFRHRLRDTRRFPSLSHLNAQLRADVEIARADWKQPDFNINF